MSEKYGKWIGGALGWAVGGPIGGIIGLGLGFLWDNATMEPQFEAKGKSQAKTRYSRTREGDFAVSLLVLSAAVMKADHKVLQSELNFVKRFLVAQFGESKTIELLQVLKKLLAQEIDIGPVCAQIKLHMNHALRLQLMHYLIGIAKADNEIHPNEWDTIKYIARHLNISDLDFTSLSAMYDVDATRHYRILEIDESATDEEVKKAYRKMAIKYHPDKLGSDVGEEVLQGAREKFNQVNESYNAIKKIRNIN